MILKKKAKAMVKVKSFYDKRVISTCIRFALNVFGLNKRMYNCLKLRKRFNL